MSPMGSSRRNETVDMERKTHQITVRGIGGQFACGEDEFVLEAMKRSGCGPIYYGCFGGGCGVCKMRVVSGEYCAEKKMSRAHTGEKEQKDGIVLICCIKPRSDLILRGCER